MSMLAQHTISCLFFKHAHKQWMGIIDTSYGSMEDLYKGDITEIGWASNLPKVSPLIHIGPFPTKSALKRAARERGATHFYEENDIKCW